VYNDYGDSMKKIILIVLALFIFINVNALEINSKNAILYNLNDNSVIYEKNSEEQVQVASLTKMVTAITVLENIEDLNEEVRITRDMLLGLNGYAKAGFKVGNKLTYEDLLYALMLPSAADAAQALAISIGGSIDEFAILMNNKVNEIGVTNSKFDNPVGMDSVNNYSTASDMAKILIYCLKNKTFETIFNSNSYRIESLNKTVKKTISSYDVDTSIIKGAKTGYETIAGLCLASTATIENVDYLLITLGADDSAKNHVIDTVNIYEYYSTNYGYINILKKDQLLETIDVKHSKTKTYDIISKEDTSLYLEKTVKDNLKYEYDGITELNRKIKVGDKLGVVNILSKDEIIYTYDVYLDTEIKYYNYILYVSIGVVIILLLTIFIKKRKIKRKKKLKK